LAVVTVSVLQGQLNESDHRDEPTEDIDVLAAQMLSRLAEDEPRTRLFDPSDAPGGKWGFSAAALTAVLLVLLVVYTILGFIFGR